MSDNIGKQIRMAEETHQYEVSYQYSEERLKARIAELTQYNDERVKIILEQEREIKQRDQHIRELEVQLEAEKIAHERTKEIWMGD